MIETLLKEMRIYAQENFVPVIRPETERILCALISQVNPKRYLEIGAAIGYSSISVSRFLSDDALVITVEKDGERADMARRNIKKAGLTSKIRLIEDDALALLTAMDNQVDMIFLDADKSHYIDYYEECLRLLRSGGVIFADNVLFAGLVEKEGVAERKHRTIVNNLRAFLKMVKDDSRVTSELLKVEDGILVIKKK